jgi:hypothetical protein
MSTRTRSRRGGFPIVRASRRAALLAILSSALLLIGQLTALADKPEDPGVSNRNENGASASAHGQDQAAARANENSNVAARTEAEAEADVEVEADVQTGAATAGSGGGNGNAGGKGGGNAGGRGGNASASIHGDDHTSKITLCHATHSTNNPYVVITVAREAAGDPSGWNQSGTDHFSHHDQGGVVYNASMQQGDEWDDIIPNVDDDGNPMPHDGLNWSADIAANWSAAISGDAGACIAAPVRQQPPAVQPDVVLDEVVTPEVAPQVAPQVIRRAPGGLAFTGPSAVAPLAALALALLTVGTGLLWAGRRRR